MRAYNISVTAPLEQAFGQVKRVLFQPFDIGKWFVIGFCAWLAYLGQGGGGGGGGFGGGQGGGRGGSQGVRDGLMEAREYLVSNMYWIVPLVAGILVVALAIWILVVWLSSRGQFMFLHCVALNRGEVQVPWRRYAAEANSLFWFRIVAGLVLMLPGLVLAGFMIFLVLQMAQHGGVPGIIGVFGFVLLILSILLLCLLAWLLRRFLTDFVVPVQYLRQESCMAAWGEVLALFRDNTGSFILYLLFRVLLAIAIGAIIMMIVLITCCIAGCLMAIPYIGTVLILPLLVFDRSYSAFFLAQFGLEYDVFSPGTAPSAGVPTL